MFTFFNMKMSIMKLLMDNQHYWTTKITSLNIALIVDKCRYGYTMIKKITGILHLAHIHTCRRVSRC